jgi:hypothetical protein
VDQVTRSKSGGDIDDGPTFIALLVTGRGDVVMLPAGHGLGTCTTDSSSLDARVCAESVAGTLVSRLTCGRDPHVDRVVCFDAVRANGRLEVTRHEWDVPVTDGDPPPPTPRPPTRAGFVDVGGAEVRVGSTEYRSVAE